MTETFLFIFVLGAVVGFYIGRWWAENKRSRWDMQRNWNIRKDYRKGPFY